MECVRYVLGGSYKEKTMNLPKNLQSVTRILDSLRYGKQLRPVRDWSVLLVVFTIVLIASMVWNTLFFFGVVNTIGGPGQRTAEQGLGTDPVQGIRDVFDTRQVEESQYKSGYHFVDPSK